MEKRKTQTPRTPVAAANAAWLENSMRGGDVALEKLPAPVWHANDGGAYIGSGSLVVMRDPDDGWINASIYRVQVHGRNRVTMQFDHPGRHGAIIAKKYRDRGLPCPVAVVNGEDPALFIAGFEYLAEGVSEYDLGDPQKQPLQFFRTRVDRVVPFRMERVAADVESLHFVIGYLDALLIGPFIERTLDLEPGFSRGRGDQLDYCSAADERLGAPVLRDVAE
jgi:UbiD family decarboxylase